MDMQHNMISAVYHNTGPVRSQRYNNDYEILFVEKGQIELTVGEKVYVARSQEDKRKQKQYFFRKNKY